MAKKKRKARKLTKFGRIVTDIILVIALGAACFSGWKLYQGLSTYNQSKSSYDTLRDAAVKKPEVSQPDSSQEQESDDTLVIDHAAMAAINPDYVGWIHMKNSDISYPMVQGTDNEYYLNHLYTKEENYVGSVFLDCNSSRDFTDRNTVIYAHNVKNGTMFMEIARFEDPSWYADHDVLEIYTASQNYRLYPVAGILTTGSDNYVSYAFESDEAYMNYVNRFVSNSTFQSNQTVTPQDQTVLLSTCSYSLTDGRYALLCRVEKF
ncbi:MAG: class B sortase [Bulleidia sp.]